MASIRAWLPRASLTLHSRQLQYRLPLLQLRYASKTPLPPPPKPRVLEKPERFNPPSHPSRRARPRQYPGPPLSEHQREQQRTRQYPRMMPPEGSWMYWFLTNRTIHAFITLGVLTSLIFAIWFTDFYHKTPFQNLLPPNSMFFSHPLSYLGRYWEVYQMHVDHISNETAERRRRKVEDVQKRSEYRKAHGLDSESAFGSWTAKSDAETLGPGLREGGGDGSVMLATANGSTLDAASLPAQGAGDKTTQNVYVDFEGKTQQARKKWFGIW